MANWTFTVESSTVINDSQGDPQLVTAYVSDADVELYDKDDLNTILAQTSDDTITNNQDGSYTINLDELGLNAGEYYLKVNGIFHDETSKIWIPSSKVLDDGDLSEDYFERVDGKIVLKSKIIGASQIKADVAGDGLKQNSDSSLSPNVDGASIVIESGKLKVPSSGHSHAFATADDIPDFSADDFVDDGGTLRIKQDFADESIISDNKALNENLELLQAEIKRVSGLLSGNAQYREVIGAIDDFKTSNTGSALSTLGTFTNGAYENRSVFYFVRPAEAKQLILRCYLAVGTPGDTFSARLSVSGSGSANVEITGSQHATLSTPFAFYLDISGLGQNYPLKIEFDVKVDAGTDVRVDREILIAQEEYITNSAGDKSWVDDPSA